MPENPVAMTYRRSLPHGEGCQREKARENQQPPSRGQEWEPFRRFRNRLRVLVHDITRREKLIALQKSNLFLSHIGLLPFKVVDGGGKSKQVLLLEESKLWSALSRS